MYQEPYEALGYVNEQSPLSQGNLFSSKQVGRKWARWPEC